MKKAQSLYNYLLDCCPELKRDPSRIDMQVRSGAVIPRLGVNLGFEATYRLNIMVMGLTGHVFSVLFPVSVWLRTHQIDLLQDPQKAKDAISMEVDVLDPQTYDLSIEIPLTEAVDVIPEGAGHKMTQRNEPLLIGTESSVGLGLLPDDVILLVNAYGELRFNQVIDLIERDPASQNP